MSIEDQFATFKEAATAARKLAVEKRKSVYLIRGMESWGISYNRNAIVYYEVDNKGYNAFDDSNEYDVPVVDSVADISDSHDRETERLLRYDDETDMRYGEQLEEADAYANADDEGWFYDD